MNSFEMYCIDCIDGENFVHVFLPESHHLILHVTGNILMQIIVGLN